MLSTDVTKLATTRCYHFELIYRGCFWGRPLTSVFRWWLRRRFYWGCFIVRTFVEVELRSIFWVKLKAISGNHGVGFTLQVILVNVVELRMTILTLVLVEHY